MRTNKTQFEGALNKAGTKELRDTTWGIYPSYKVSRAGGDTFMGGRLGQPRERRGTLEERRVSLTERKKRIRRYRPLVDKPGLFIEFARLAERDITEDRWLNFVNHKGVLGFEQRSDRHGAEERGGRAETLEAFQREAERAHKALKLFEAATRPNYGPDVNTIASQFPTAPSSYTATPQRAKDLALFEVGEMVQERLNTETFPQLYSMPDGSFQQAHGFRSLRGALWLQMMYLMLSDDSRRCKRCGAVIDFETPEQPPAPDGGRRSTYKTRRDREFCDNNKRCYRAYRRAHGYDS